MKRNIWGVFHDGIIKRIEGHVPGSLRIEVEIDYLRGMFPDPGDSFVIELLNCSLFQFAEYDEPPTIDLTRIQDQQPEILYVTTEEPLVLECASGTLELAYEAMRVLLPSHEEVTEQALTAACEKYWNDWQSRADANLQSH